MEVMLREADGDTIDAVMEAHEADLCLDAGGATRSVEWLPLCRDQLMAVLPKGHRLARERAVSLEALQQERLLLPLKGYGRAAHQVLDRLSGNPAVPGLSPARIIPSFPWWKRDWEFPSCRNCCWNTPRTALYRFRWSRPVPDAGHGDAVPEHRVAGGSEFCGLCAGLCPGIRCGAVLRRPKWMKFTENVEMRGWGLLTGRNQPYNINVM